jgi:hypothetical protein
MALAVSCVLFSIATGNRLDTPRLRLSRHFATVLSVPLAALILVIILILKWMHSLFIPPYLHIGVITTAAVIEALYWICTRFFYILRPQTSSSCHQLHSQSIMIGKALVRRIGAVTIAVFHDENEVDSESGFL